MNKPTRIPGTPEVRRAIAYYRALIAEQRALPQSEAWRMGSLIRHAQHRATVEIEAARAVHGRDLG